MLDAPTRDPAAEAILARYRAQHAEAADAVARDPSSYAAWWRERRDHYASVLAAEPLVSAAPAYVVQHIGEPDIYCPLCAFASADRGEPGCLSCAPAAVGEECCSCGAPVLLDGWGDADPGPLPLAVVDWSPLRRAHFTEIRAARYEDWPKSSSRSLTPVAILRPWLAARRRSGVAVFWTDSAHAALRWHLADDEDD